MSDTSDREPPFEGGSQPVPHVKDPVPGPGRSAMQIVVLVIVVLVVLAGLAFFFRWV